MDYFVRRGEEQFGPYTLAELQEYVQTGRVLPTDLAKSEGLTEWVPVSEIIGTIRVPSVSAPQDVVVPPEIIKLPPNLHWALLLLLVIITRQLFNWIWAFVLANWARKLSGNNKAMVLVAMYPAGLVAGAVVMGVGAGAGVNNVAASVLGLICILGGAIAYLFGIFKVRDAMEEYYNSRENIGLSLSGVMTFFFSSVYLQYHVNRIARWKKTGVLS
jgi:hypothetical protein